MLEAEHPADRAKEVVVSGEERHSEQDAAHSGAVRREGQPVEDHKLLADRELRLGDEEVEGGVGAVDTRNQDLFEDVHLVGVPFAR